MKNTSKTQRKRGGGGGGGLQGKPGVLSGGWSAFGGTCGGLNCCRTKKKTTTTPLNKNEKQKRREEKKPFGCSWFSFSACLPSSLFVVIHSDTEFSLENSQC